MRKGLAIGFLLGALAAGVFLRVLQRSENAQDGGSAAGEAGGDRKAAVAGSPDAAALQRDLATARAEAETLRAKVVELESRIGRTPPPALPLKSDRAAKWKELAERIAAAKREAEASGGPIKNDTWLAALVELIGQVAGEMGLPLQEAAMSPDWYPVLALSLLDASPFPLTADQRARCDEILATARTDWDLYEARREGMTPLERAQAMRDIEFGTRMRLAALGTADQIGYVASVNLPPPIPPVGSTWLGAGPREAVRSNLSKNWQQALKLEDAQVTALGPVMDDYVRQMESLQKDVARRRQAGETFDDVAPKLALMVEMQKRVGSTVRLSDAQARALRDWNSTYDFQVKE